MNAEVPPPTLLAPPKNVEPPKSSIDEVLKKKSDVVMKPPSDLIPDKKEDLLVPKEPLSKYPPKEDYYKKPSTAFDPKRYARDDDRDYRAKRD